MAKNRKSSYQKLKEKNQELMRDIRILVHKDTPAMKRAELQLSYRMLFEVEDQVWYGSSTIKS